MLFNKKYGENFPTSVGCVPTFLGNAPTLVGNMPTSWGKAPTLVGSIPTDCFIFEG